jgi:hypothetical protein
MPLDEREQRILKEIEDRFYEEDPDLVNTVRSIEKSAESRMPFYMAIAGLVLGIGILLGTFTLSRWVALAGFVVMVVSGTALVQVLRRRSGKAPIAFSPAGSVADWLDKIRKRRFRR